MSVGFVEFSVCVFRLTLCYTLHPEENKVPQRQSPKCKWIIAGNNWVRNRNNEARCNRFVKAEKSEEWMARSPV